MRASTGTAVQQTNCHPFRHGRWLFIHRSSSTSRSRSAWRKSRWLYAVRYASGGRANTLYVSTGADDLKRLYPHVPEIQALSDDARAVVSEPLARLPGLWHEVPPATALVIQPGADEEVPFRPRAP